MKNVEYKAELRDPELAEHICKRLGAAFIATLEQTDTYYRVTSGRLKKRECVGQPTEWIRYNRDNDSGPRTSNYTLYSEEQAREHFGAAILDGSTPIWLQVVKTRKLYMLGSTRIHLDRVQDLGAFLEFEALMTRAHPIDKCHESVATLRQALAPALGEPISTSYSDLLAKELEIDAFDASENHGRH